MLTKRALNQARRDALITANRINSAYRFNSIPDWASIESQFALSVPDSFKSLPITYANVSAFARYWQDSVEQRITVAQTRGPSMIITEKPKILEEVSTFHKVTLFPEQEGVYRKIYKALFPGIPDHVEPTDQVNISQGVPLALQDGFTGSGKTFIAAAVIAKLIDSNILNHPSIAYTRPLHPIIIVTPKPVVESWCRVLEDFGLSTYLNTRQILVMADSEFSADHSRAFVDEHQDIQTGDTTLKWNPMMAPLLIITDECHRYVNPKSYRTQCMRALDENPLPVKWLIMSATPFEKINDCHLMVSIIKPSYAGLRITAENFKFFAEAHDNTPHKPNRAAMKRLRETLSPYIFSIPYTKPKHKAINVVQLVDFKSPKDAAIYDSAHKRYLEACKKSGKATDFGRFAVFIELNNYRKTVEPLRAWWLAQRAAENYARQTATAVGTAFKETITEVAFQLTTTYNIPREKISVIWGGKKEYKPSDLLSKAQLDNILKASADDMMTLLSDKDMLRRVKITLRYIQDQHEHDETVEQQSIRHAKLKELKLIGKQSDNARQVEVDRFQSGESVIALFTNASGGVGLSFDRNKEHLWTREGLFTPVYSGKEFQQVLGRLVRRSSLSDAVQRICMMRDTVEEFHVAPILDEKLKCIAEITNRSFDIIDLLNNEAPASHAKLRSEGQACLDAENDDTIVDVKESESDEDEDESDEL